MLRDLGLEWSDSTGFAVLRKIRGQLLRRAKTGPVEVVAEGRADWIGWVELVKAAIDAQAMAHTAMGVMAPSQYQLVTIRSHVFDRDDEGTVFSRDCPECTFTTPGGNTVTVLINHLKSKGYSSPGDRTGAKRRRRQAVRIAQIYRDLRAVGAAYVAVLGDLNDDLISPTLAPLLVDTDLRDISTHHDFEFGPRQGHLRRRRREDKIDYVLLSPELYATATGGQVPRKGVHHGPNVVTVGDGRAPCRICPGGQLERYNRTCVCPAGRGRAA